VEAEVEVWKHRDPIARVKTLLSKEFNKKAKDFDAVDAEADQIALKLRDDVLAMQRPEPISMFDNVYAEPHPLVEEGRQEFIELGITGGSH
jgi:pyruvate dehydrogenase E1 component alpha subunit